MGVKTDLYWLAEGCYKVSRDERKPELCKCPVPGQHKPSCIWFAARKFLPEVQKAILRLDLEDEE